MCWKTGSKKVDLDYVAGIEPKDETTFNIKINMEKLKIIQYLTVESK